MSVSAVNSATNSYLNSMQSAYNQQAQNFKTLSSAIQSGNLSGAQKALAAFQHNIQTTSDAPLSTAVSDPNSQASNNLRSLMTALQSNDRIGAQSAFTTLRQTLNALFQQRSNGAADTSSSSSVD